MEREYTQSKEVLQPVERYENRLQRRNTFDGNFYQALGEQNLRWDITSPHLLPPPIIRDDNPDASFGDTVDGRPSAIAKIISDNFSTIGYHPDIRTTIDGLTDAFVAGAVRLGKAMPQEKEKAAYTAMQTGILTLRNLQLANGRVQKSSSQESQFTMGFLEELELTERTEPLLIRSIDQGFMTESTDNLRDFFLGSVERLLDPEHDEAFMFVRNAMRFAENVHGDQKRFDGTLNKDHVMRLGIRLLEDPHFMSAPTPLHIKLGAAVLHDTVEDTDTPLTNIQEVFGDEVTHAVDLLSRYVMTTGEYRSDYDYYARIQEVGGYVADVKGHDRVDNLEALILFDLNTQDRQEIVFKGVEYLQRTKENYPPIISNNPYLQERLYQSLNNTEKHFYIYV